MDGSCKKKLAIYTSIATLTCVLGGHYYLSSKVQLGISIASPSHAKQQLKGKQQ